MYIILYFVMSDILLVDILLKDLCEYFDADRIVLADIHSYSYKDYDAYDKYFSVKYEYLKDTFSIKDIVKNIPLDVLRLEYPYYKNNIIVCDINKQSTDFKGCVDHLTNINADVIINCFVYFNKSIIGILSVQYTKAKSITCFESLSSQDKNKLNSICNSLSRFL